PGHHPVAGPATSTTGATPSRGCAPSPRRTRGRKPTRPAPPARPAPKPEPRSRVSPSAVAGNGLLDGLAHVVGDPRLRHPTRPRRPRARGERHLQAVDGRADEADEPDGRGLQ